MAQAGRRRSRPTTSPSTTTSSRSSRSTPPAPARTRCSRSPTRRPRRRVDGVIAQLAGRRRHEHLRGPPEPASSRRCSRKAESTHIILMTDGVSAPANYPPLVAQMRKAEHHALDRRARQRRRPAAAARTSPAPAAGATPSRPTRASCRTSSRARCSAASAPPRWWARSRSARRRRARSRAASPGKKAPPQRPRGDDAAARAPARRSSRTSTRAPTRCSRSGRPASAAWPCSRRARGRWAARFVRQDPALFDDAVRWAAAPPEPPVLEPALVDARRRRARRAGRSAALGRPAARPRARSPGSSRSAARRTPLALRPGRPEPLPGRCCRRARAASPTCSSPTPAGTLPAARRRCSRCRRRPRTSPARPTARC